MRPALACLSALLLCAPGTAQQGRLQKARQEMNPPRASEPSARGSDHPGTNDNDDDEEGFFDELFGGVLTGLLQCAWWALDCDKPIAEAADDDGRFAYFNRFPYADGRPGLMGIHWPSEQAARILPPEPIDDENADWRAPARRAPVNVLPAHARYGSMRLLIDNSNDFDGLNRVNGRFFIETVCRLGLEAGWSYLRERLADGSYDSLHLGDVTVTICALQMESLQFHFGVGCRWLADPGDSTGGLNLLLSGDYFPVKPVVLSAVIDGGNLGAASVIHCRGTVGVVHRHGELFTGYDWLRIGSVDFQGPLVGLRFWF